MQIAEAIETWCKKRNRVSGANKGILFLILALGLFTYMTFQQDSLAWMLGALTSFVFWIVFLPHPADADDLRTSQNVRTASDSLLDSIAEDQELPVWAKAEIAQQLKAHGAISFASLFAIDDKMAAEERARRNAEGKGFQKMAGYASDAIDAPKH